MVDNERADSEMLCHFCKKSAYKKRAICKTCKKCFRKIYTYKKKHLSPHMLQFQQIIQKQHAKVICKILRKKLADLENEILCVTNRVTISKQAVLQRNNYNVASGLKRIIKNTVKAKFAEFKTELTEIITTRFNNDEYFGNFPTLSEESEQEIERKTEINHPGSFVAHHKALLLLVFCKSA